MRGVSSNLCTRSAGQALCLRNSWSNSIVTFGTHSKSALRSEFKWVRSGFQTAPCSRCSAAQSRDADTEYLDLRPPSRLSVFRFHKAVSNTHEPSLSLLFGFPRRDLAEFYELIRPMHLPPRGSRVPRPSREGGRNGGDTSSSASFEFCLQSVFARTTLQPRSPRLPVSSAHRLWLFQQNR